MQVRRRSQSAISKGYAIASLTDAPENILEKIVWRKEDEVAKMYADAPIASIKSMIADRQSARDFLGGLQNSSRQPALIAEVKKASPSKGIFRENFDPVAIAQAYASGGASCLSVLTDREFFQGSFENLQLVREAVDLPLLCKEFIIDPYQIYMGRSAGADAVLLIAAILTNAELAEFHTLIQELGMTALVEVHTQAELERVLEIDMEINNVKLIGINNRNLETFVVDLTQTQILMNSLDATTRDKYLWVSESGIHVYQDLEFVRNCGAAAVLVGESLIKQENVETAIAALFTK
jgi:indole-3-glycerol phosphate synthase